MKKKKTLLKLQTVLRTVRYVKDLDTERRNSEKTINLFLVDFDSIYLGCGPFFPPIPHNTALSAIINTEQL